MSEKTLKTFISLKRATAYVEHCVKADVMAYNLNVSEFAILEYLYHKGKQPIQSIAEAILIANSSTTYTIDKLCQKNLTIRLQDEKDKRVFYVTLTQEGEALMTRSFPKHAQMIEQLFGEFTNEELNQFHYLLKKLARYDANGNK